MSRPKEWSSIWIDRVFMVLGSLVLLTCLGYGALLLRQVAPDFRVDLATWKVIKGQPCSSEELCLRAGDQILELGGVERDAYFSDRTQSLSWTEGPLDVRFERDGSERHLTLEPPSGSTLGRRLEDTLILLVSLVFWICGTAAGLFLRPRNECWLLMLLFGYVTALWFAAGALSATQLGLSVIVFHTASWLFLPLTTHLHLTLPSVVLPKRARIALLALVYSVSLVGLGGDLGGWLPEGSFGVPVVAALGISLLVLGIRQSLPGPPSERQASRLMLFGNAVGLGPWLLLVALDLPGQLDHGMAAGAPLLLRSLLLATVPLLPATYLYAAAKKNLGVNEFRANRLLGLWTFLVCVVVLQFLLLLVGLETGALETNPILFCLGGGMISAIGGKSLFQLCQRTFDRRVLGILHTPDEILRVFAQNIPQLYEEQALVRLLHEEVLPTMMIRQSALYIFEADEVRKVYETGVEALDANERATLSRVTQDFVASGHLSAESPDWVRQALPLWSESTLTGIWLFGRRDPDDYYPQSDVALLRQASNQMASLLRVQSEIRERRFLQEQLFQSQKLEAIGRLSAGVAHDFNNLLAVIHLHGEFLMPWVREEETARGHLEGILAAGERAKNLIRQLLAFSRQQMLDVQVFDLTDIVTELETMLRTLLGDHVDLEIRKTAGLPPVEIDRSRIEQVIVNLALNASQAMPNGGPVEIWVEHVRKGDGSINPGEVELGSDELLVLRVRDRGTGISEEVQDRMFEPFYTTRPAGQGSGLGLAIVYGIVRQSGGQISVDSREGHGTTISVWLPASQQVQEASPERVERLDDGYDRGTILLVEDEGALRGLLAEALENEGYSVLTAVDGLDALELFESWREPVDLLVTDVMMPRMGGFELAERLREACPGLKTLFISGYNQSWKNDGFEMSTDDAMLQKPFTVEALRRQVQRTLTTATSSSSSASGIRSDLLAGSNA